MKRKWTWIFLAAELLLAVLAIRGGLQAARIAPVNGTRLLVCWCAMTALAVGGGLWWQFHRSATSRLQAVVMGVFVLGLGVLSVVLRRWCLPLPAVGEDAFYAAMVQALANWELVEPLWLVALFLPQLATVATRLRANFWRMDDKRDDKAESE